MKYFDFKRAALALFIAGAVLVPASLVSQSNTPVGVWQTIGDKGENKGKVTSHIKIWEASDGTLRGTIIKPISNPDGKCSADCPGRLADQPLKGLNIMWGFKAAGGNVWDGGKIVDPEDGSVYSCKLTVQGNKLQVRGFIGVSLLGRTQTWNRLQ